MQPKRLKPAIKAAGRVFPVTRQSTPGYANNCLGYALRDALLVTPQELREQIATYVQTTDEETQVFLASSVLEDSDDLSKAALVSGAVRALNGGCFIPADVFLNFASETRCRKTLKRVNLVFMSESACGGTYIPVCCHWEDRRRFPTHYVGCNHCNTHYTTLLVDAGDQRELNALIT